MSEIALNEAGYSVCQKETPYTGQWPKIPEFEKPWEYAVQFGQGRAEISLSGRPLQSDGFSRCTGLILQKEGGLETYAAHIEEMLLNDRQLEVLSSLSGGKYIGRFIRGSISRDLRSIIMNPRISLFMSVFSKGREITILDDIVVNTGQLHWAMVYKSDPRLLMVQSKLSHSVKEFDFLK